MAVALESRAFSPIKEEDCDKDIRIRVHYASFLPWGTLVSNKRLAEWAKKAGYDDGVEWMALQLAGLPFGPAHEVKVKSAKILSEALVDVKSAHVVFNPYATTWRILTGAPDGIKPDAKLPKFLLAFASGKNSLEAIHKLEQVKAQAGESLPVVTYPFLGGKDIYGPYRFSLLQTAVYYFDRMTPKEMIQAVYDGRYQGIAVDLLHMREGYYENKDYPFLPWQKTLEQFWKAGVLKEIHIQPGGNGQPSRGISDSIDGELAALAGGTEYNTELDNMIRFLKNLGFRGPYVTEINPMALAKLQGQKILRIGDLIKSHQEIVDHIKRN